MRTRETGAFHDILAALAEDSVNLVQTQYDLLRAETGIAAKRVFVAVLLGVFGLAATMVATVFLGVALFEWLTIVLASRLLAALAVAGITALVAICTLAAAYRLFALTSFVPRRTLASLSRNTRVFFGEPRDE